MACLLAALFGDTIHPSMLAPKPHDRISAYDVTKSGLSGYQNRLADHDIVNDAP
jgi:hypothetical protein